MRGVAHYIERHYAEPLTLDRLARVAGWSKRQLSAMFRREVGRTVHEYVTRVRIREAATLIARGVKIGPSACSSVTAVKRPCTGRSRHGHATSEIPQTVA